MFTESEDFTRTHRLRIYPREKQSVFRKKLPCHDLHLENTDSSWSIEPESGPKASRSEFQQLIYLDPSAMLKGEQMDSYVTSPAVFLKKKSLMPMEPASSTQGFPSHSTEHFFQQPFSNLPPCCGVFPAAECVPGRLMKMT